MPIQNPDCYFPLEQPCGKLVSHMDARCFKQYGLVILFASYAVLEVGCEKMCNFGKEMMHELLTHSIGLV